MPRPAAIRMNYSSIVHSIGAVLGLRVCSMRYAVLLLDLAKCSVTNIHVLNSVVLVLVYCCCARCVRRTHMERYV